MSGPRRSRSTVIVILLVATLAMTAMLAREAQQAARSHRATAENVLREYATFAAWELSRTGRTQVMNAIQQELEEVRTAIARGGLDAAVGTARCTAECVNGTHHIRTAFTASFPDGRFSYAGESADPAIVRLLADVTAEGRRKPKDFTCPAFRIVRTNGADALVIWRPVLDKRDTPVSIVGFVTDPAFVARVFERLVRQNPLLPPSLVPAGENPNAALAVRIATPEGHQLFASGPEWSAYTAREQLPRELGALSLAVALKPDAAGKLVIGGLPRERLPLVVGLLTLTACLVIVALVQLRREAELSRLRSDFVSGVSHELRTPLAQIRMFSETLLLGRVRSETEGRRSLEIIAREAQRLAQLVENVLLFARGERRQPQIAREATRLSPLVADVLESFAPLAAARHTRLVADLDHTVSAHVDSGAIRQILLNLLDNAVKYGPEGQTVTVMLRLDGDRVRLVVEDEGPGINARDAERIWHPFSRLARAASAAPTGGAGIGLAIVRQLAELHGGCARVESAPHGARFIVEIPGAWSAGATIAVA
jgi:signal transduction histidine kinase